jgi:hypothetical protein
LKDRLRAYSQAREVKAVRRDAAGLSAADRDALLGRVSGKTLLFAIASGRSGTQTLAKILEAIPGIYATHEGVPAFHDVMRAALQAPDLARDFLWARKFPAIAAQGEPVYAETSHVFGKGFLAPMLELGLRPKLILLKRDPRKIALSLERIGATPLRTRGGREHFLSPADPSLLPTLQWNDFTNYQLCYWYALETMRRQRILHEMAVRAGCVCRFVRIDDLQTPADAWALLASLGVPVHRSDEAEAALQACVGQAFNLKPKSPPLMRMNAELEVQEQVVLDRIQACLPELNLRQMVAHYLNDAPDAAQAEKAAPAARREAEQDAAQRLRA